MTVSVSLKAKDNISPVVAKVNTSLSKFEAKAKSIRNTSAKIGAVSTAGLIALTSAVGGVVNKYQDLAAAQGEIKSLGLGSSEIKAVTKEAKAFSNTFSGTTQAEFVRASYDIKSGISSLSAVGVAKFTALAALTGKATKSTTTQMTSFFATGYGIYAKQFDALQAKTITGWKTLSQEEKDIKFGEYFAAGIAGTVKEFKTNGTQMQSAIENLGATATTSNVPLSEQLSILGMLQKSMSGSEAATKYRAFLNAAVGAQKKLKLQFLDSNKQLKSTPEILDVLRKKYGDTLDDMEKQSLKKAFGTDEALAYITALYSESDKLRESQKRLSTTMRSGTKDILTMAQAMNEGKEFELLSQRASNLATTIGAKFAPMAILVAEKIGDITTSIDSWMNANEGVVNTIVSIVSVGGGMLATVAALSIGVSALSFMAGGVIKPLRGLMWLFGRFSKKGKMAAKAVTAVNTGLDAIAGKSVSARLGMVMPNKSALVSEATGIRAALVSILSSPIIITATMAAVGAGMMADAQHTQLMDNRTLPSRASVDKIKAKISRLEARIKAMKGNGNLGDRAKEWLLNGNATESEIHQQEKLLARAKKRLAKVSPVMQAHSTSAVPKAYIKTKAEIAQMREKALANAYKIRDERKAQLATKKRTKNKTVNVSAPIHITVNAVNGKVPTNEIGSVVQHGIKKAVQSAHSTSYEDQE